MSVRDGITVTLTEDDRRKAFEWALKMHKLRQEIMNAKDNELNEKIKAYLAFARVGWKDWERIKITPTNELKKEFIGLSILINFCFGIRDNHMRDLMTVELKKRNVDFQELTMEIEKGIKAAEEEGW